MEPAEPSQLPFLDPFGIKSSRQMLHAMIEEAFEGINPSENKINYLQAEVCLRFVFKRLRPIVPLPDDDWYRTVFANYDDKGRGALTREEFEDIVKEYHGYYLSRARLRGRRKKRCFGAAFFPFPPPEGLPANPPQEKLKKPSPPYPLQLGLCPVFVDYLFGPELGRGTFGNVKIAKDRKTNAARACKAVTVCYPHRWQMVKSEVETLRSLSHPNILKLYEAYQDGYVIYLILELCKGGLLFDCIVKHYLIHRSRISEHQAGIWVHQILSVCAFCHERGIVHRDLKPDNILLLDDTEASPLKVIDFGLGGAISQLRGSRPPLREKKKNALAAALVNYFPFFRGRSLPAWWGGKKHMQRAGTPHYMAPEMIRGDYDEKCDLFSVGVIMFQLLSGYHPFFIRGLDTAPSAKTKILRKEPLFTREIWDSVSCQAKDLLQQLLQKDSTQRISAKDALAHPWFELASIAAPSGFQLPLSVREGLRSWKEINKFKKSLLGFVTRDLMDADLRWLRARFKAADKTGKGFISLAQLRDSMRGMGFNVNDERLDVIFNHIDEERRGFVDYDEFLRTLLARRVLVREEEQRKIFERFEAEKRKGFTLEQFKKGVKGSKCDSLTEPEMEQLFSEIQRNADKDFDFEKFCYLLEAMD